MFVNCQLEGRRLRRVRFESEGRGFNKEAAPEVRLGGQAFELEEAFGAVSVPAAALAFEASVNFHFDVLFHGAAAAFDSGGGPAHGAPQASWDLFPRINALAVAQEVTEEFTKLFGPLVPEWTLT